MEFRRAEEEFYDEVAIMHLGPDEEGLLSPEEEAFLLGYMAS